MLAKALTLRIKRSSRSASRHSQDQPSSSANASKMGNTPSTQQSPKYGPSSIGQSSTLSSSVDMPGAESPKVGMQPDLQERAEEAEESGVSGTEDADKKKSSDELGLLIPPVPREVAVPVEEDQPEPVANAPNAGLHVTDSSRHSWLPGTHVLVNVGGGTALDLCGADQRNLVGWPIHMGPNQQVRPPQPRFLRSELNTIH